VLNPLRENLFFLRRLRDGNSVFQAKLFVVGIHSGYVIQHKYMVLDSNTDSAIDNPFSETCCIHSEYLSLDVSTLHNLERRLGESFSSDKRRAEFYSGRRCAVKAMVAAGYPRLPVLRHRNRSPDWPLSVVGSITHGVSQAVAIVGRGGSGVVGLGIDIEDISRKLKTDISRYVLTHWEIERWINNDWRGMDNLKVIFSIKESVYKCLNPIDGIRLGFHDAEVTEISSSSFRVKLIKNPFRRRVNTPFEMEGRLSLSRKWIFSALQVLRGDY
jgi:enterobactin synthetase component D